MFWILQCGYFLKTKKIFLKCKNLEQWLLKGHYDMVNSSFEFVKKFDYFLDKDILYTNLNKIQNILNKKITLRSIKKEIITDFKRKNEPLILLTSKNKIKNFNFKINKKMLYLKDGKILQILQEQTKKHYKKHNGKLEFWGNILSYNITYKNKIYKFTNN